MTKNNYYDIIIIENQERKQNMLPTFKIIFERWKYNKDYELYVSNLGRVKTKDKELVKPKTATKGYMAVSFWKSGKMHLFYSFAGMPAREYAY